LGINCDEAEKLIVRRIEGATWSTVANVECAVIEDLIAICSLLIYFSKNKNGTD
jgi:hypothetical protein